MGSGAGRLQLTHGAIPGLWAVILDGSREIPTLITNIGDHIHCGFSSLGNTRAQQGTAANRHLGKHENNPSLKGQEHHRETGHCCDPASPSSDTETPGDLSGLGRSSQDPPATEPGSSLLHPREKLQ